MTNEERTGLIWIILGSMGYAFFPIIVRGVYRVSDFDAFDLGLWRFFLATPLIWFVLRLREDEISRQITLPRLQLLGMGVIFSGAALTAFIGLDNIANVSTYVVLFFTYPLMVAILSLFFGERSTWIMWIAIGVGLMGIALTVPDFASIGPKDRLGMLFALLNALIVAVYFMVSRKLLHGLPTIVVMRGTAWVITGAMMIFLAVNLITDGINIPDDSQSWILLILLATVSTFVPLIATNIGIQKLGASRAAVISTFEPVMTIIVASIFLNEQTRLIQWFGGGLIVLSILLLQFRDSILPKSEREIREISIQ